VRRSAFLIGISDQTLRLLDSTDTDASTTLVGPQPLVLEGIEGQLSAVGRVED
jgi:hypothetical protein